MLSARNPAAAVAMVTCLAVDEGRRGGEGRVVAWALPPSPPASPE